MDKKFIGVDYGSEEQTVVSFLDKEGKIPEEFIQRDLYLEIAKEVGTITRSEAKSMSYLYLYSGRRGYYNLSFDEVKRQIVNHIKLLRGEVK